MMRKLLLPLALIVVILTALGAMAILPRFRTPSDNLTPSASPTPLLPAITSFEQCVAAGYPIQESQPERCITPEGVAFERPAPTEQMEISGKILCLPKKNQRGPQTLECAIGLQGKDGKYYGLVGENGQPPANLTMQSSVTLTGRLIPLNPQAKLPYDIAGVIQVTSVK